jgi:hypothetical protein
MISSFEPKQNNIKIRLDDYGSIKSTANSDQALAYA